jgi:thymidine phosphorylase
MQDDFLLKVMAIGINTQQEPIAYLHRDSHICRAEGFSANSRVMVYAGGREVIATLDVVENHIIDRSEIGLSNIAMERLGVEPGTEVAVTHAPIVDSLRLVRKKIYGHTLSADELQEIMEDITAYRYRDVEIASFLSVCAGNRMNLDEITSITKAMVNCGQQLSWGGNQRIFDKHCIGGLPGNRTTPLVVAIASAAGLIMPKTSSRSITSPAGTADTMESLFNVSFSIEEMQEIVNATGACMVWGGSVSLSPADDLMVRIEKELEIDGQGQLIASVLSKKIAAGATDVVIDIPVGETAKVRSLGEADYLASLFNQVAQECGIHVRCVITDGSKPVGRGIGPVEEARDLMAVLQCEPGAPHDLRQRSLELAANLLDMAEEIGIDKARAKATRILEDGRAWKQFQRIAAAQGGLKSLREARFSITEKADRGGLIQSVDNRRLARLAKLAGAPGDQLAGLRLHANAGSHVEIGDPLFTLYAESAGERDYAIAYYQKNRGIFKIEEDN